MPLFLLSREDHEKLKSEIILQKGGQIKKILIQGEKMDVSTKREASSYLGTIKQK